MSLESLAKNLDAGLYTEALAKGVSASLYLAQQAERAGVAPEDAERRQIEARALRLARCSELCPHYERQVRAVAVARWTLEKLLSEAAGAPFETLTLEKAFAASKFFTSGSSTVLFPAWVDSQIATGILAASLAPLIITAEVAIDTKNAAHAAITSAKGDRTAGITGEGARAPRMKLATAERTIKPTKFTAELDASYEVLRLQRVPVIAAFLQKLGAELGVDETDDLIEVAIAGDGNSGSAVTDTDAEVSGTLDYDEIVRLWLAYDEGYEQRVCVFGDTLGRTLLQLTPFSAAANFQAGARCDGPMNALWKLWSSLGSASFSTDRILSFDNRQAMVQYTEGGAPLIETQRLIDRQWERIVVSKRTGFGKLSYGATQCLDVTTS